MTDWIYVEDDLPPTKEYTRCLVSITSDERTWVAADRYDGYSHTFEQSYSPTDRIRVYAWMPHPAPAESKPTKKESRRA